MNLDEMAAQYSGPDGRREGEQYLRQENLLGYLNQEEGERIPPDYRDLARLHRIVRERKVFSILEFGVGYSTLVMADALMKNRAEWDAQVDKPSIRNSTAFMLFSVDTEAAWIQVVQCSLPEHLKSYISISRSDVIADLFQGRSCHFYKQIPRVVPDLIYLDGPDPRAVLSTDDSGEWSNPDKVVMSADILRMEPWLLPGTCVIVDGRTANVRFLLAHLYRNWVASRSEEGNVTVLELQEPPLGKISRDTMEYCLGNRIENWSQY